MTVRHRGPASTLVVAAIALSAPASASAERNSFEGSCSAQGTTTFDPPVTNATRLTTFEFRGGGRCTGRLNGRDVSNAPARAHVVGPLKTSCAAGRGPEPARAKITFTQGTHSKRDDVTIRAKFLDNTATGPNFEGRLKGKKSGSAQVRGTFVTPRTPPDITTKCFGKGISKVPTDVSFVTDSPLVSRRR